MYRFKILHYLCSNKLANYCFWFCFKLILSVYPWFFCLHIESRKSPMLFGMTWGVSKSWQFFFSFFFAFNANLLYSAPCGNLRIQNTCVAILCSDTFPNTVINGVATSICIHKSTCVLHNFMKKKKLIKNNTQSKICYFCSNKM